ncbi:Uncharacterized protein GBIM_04837, partial [Gryllus bimaculatus]
APLRPALRHNFAPPQPPPPPEPLDGPDAPDAPAAAAAAHHHHNDATANPPPPLKNEIVVDRLASVSARGRYEALRKEASDLEVQIKQLQDALDTLLRIQQRSLESSLFNKANELQEDISLKRFDLRVAQIHLGAVRAQRACQTLCDTECAALRVAEGAVRREGGRGVGRGTRAQNVVFVHGQHEEQVAEGLQEPQDHDARQRAGERRPAARRRQPYFIAAYIHILEVSQIQQNPFQLFASVYQRDYSLPFREKKRNGKEREMSQQPADAAAHAFQEYTYKKITPCDACSQVLRGHTRQGLKCRNCKLNVHVDCQDKLGRCQPKSRLLRRQKSTSEIETRLPEPPEEEIHTNILFISAIIVVHFHIMVLLFSVLK